MKRICAWILMLFMLLPMDAQAALDANSFTDDRFNSGRFESFCMIGEYVYWLRQPDISLKGKEPPANLYRMKPGGQGAEMILEGGEDRWFYGLHAIGDQLLLSVADGYAQVNHTHPATVNPDGSGYKRLSGNIGSVVIYGGKIYNSADGAIYEISPDTMKPKRIYKYPQEIAGENPILTQRTGMQLLFQTDGFDWYVLDLQTDNLRKIASVRGDGFILNHAFYIGDFDNSVTWRFDLATGEKTKVCDRAYSFRKGSGEYVLAVYNEDLQNGWTFEANEEPYGCIFDMTWMGDDLENALIGKCSHYDDFMLNGQLYHFDYQNNRVDPCPEAVAEVIKK